MRKSGHKHQTTRLYGEMVQFHSVALKGGISQSMNLGETFEQANSTAGPGLTTPALLHFREGVRDYDH